MRVPRGLDRRRAYVPPDIERPQGVGTGNMPCFSRHMRCSHLAVHAGRGVPSRVTLSNRPKNCSLLPGQVLDSFLIQQSAVTERYIEEGTDDLIHVIAING